MYKVLENTAFGFVIELNNESAYYSENYEVYLNGEFYTKDNVNVLSVFGLKPSTEYNVCFKFEDREVEVNVTTKEVGYLVNVKDYNAIGDGVIDDTSAILMAIYTAPKNATVYFPKGEYLVNHILLKSNVNLYFEDGVVIKQSFKRHKLAIIKGYQKDYDHTEAEVNGSWEGNPLDTYCPLIYGKDVKNVTIYGNGVIDGNGDISGFWNDPKSAKVNGVWDNPNDERLAYRPKNIEFVHCKNISVLGLTSRNSASWNVHPMYSKHIKFYCLTLESIETSPNTDGLNPESCEDVEIIGCKFSVGDDCIAIKSGKYFMSVGELHKPCKEIIVRNCKMEKGHGAIVVGSEISNGVIDVTVSQCYFENTDRGIRIKTRRGRGEKSVIDNIKIENVVMDNVVHGVVLNMFYYCDPDGHSDYVRSKLPLEITEETPSIKRIFINNVKFKNVDGVGIFAYGLPEQKIEVLSIKNSEFSFTGGKTDIEPAMLDDFEPVDNLGIFIKNVDKFEDENNVYIGEYKTIIE